MLNLEFLDILGCFNVKFHFVENRVLYIISNSGDQFLMRLLSLIFTDADFCENSDWQDHHTGSRELRHS